MAKTKRNKPQGADSKRFSCTLFGGCGVFAVAMSYELSLLLSFPAICSRTTGSACLNHGVYFCGAL